MLPHYVILLLSPTHSAQRLSPGTGHLTGIGVIAA